MAEVRALREEPGARLHDPVHLRRDTSAPTPGLHRPVDDGHGDDDLLNLLVEVTGQARRTRRAKVATARELWVPGVNNHGASAAGRSSRSTDPWNAENAIRDHLASRLGAAA